MAYTDRILNDSKFKTIPTKSWHVLPMDFTGATGNYFLGSVTSKRNSIFVIPGQRSICFLSTTASPLLFNALKDMPFKHLTCGSISLKAEPTFSRPTVPVHCIEPQMDEPLFLPF